MAPAPGKAKRSRVSSGAQAAAGALRTGGGGLQVPIRASAHPLALWRRRASVHDHGVLPALGVRWACVGAARAQAARPELPVILVTVVEGY